MQNSLKFTTTGQVVLEKDGKMILKSIVWQETQDEMLLVLFMYYGGSDTEKREGAKQYQKTRLFKNTKYIKKNLNIEINVNYLYQISGNKIIKREK